MTETTAVFRPLREDDPRLVGRYRLAARLGAGGMGQVYLSHTPGGRPVAVKVVRPELADDPDFRKRFRREVGAARRVKGAYTAELIDADADGVRPWLATLYVPGPSLAEVVARHGPLPAPAVLWMLAGVAEALQVIHGEGIVHRDLKPSNVLLAADGPRVIDFGISLAADATSHTATGAVIGTPTFMAPEQASGGEITAATDVFALGQTAAFAALGQPLYGEGTSAGVLYRIVHNEPELDRLPAQLRPLIARCLAADPNQRAAPAEIVEWCRQRLGPDADGGGAPPVWQELRGPDLPVPAPVPHPTPVVTQAVYARNEPFAPPQPPPPASPEERRARRRRALVTTVAVMAGVLLLAGLVSMIADGAGRLLERSASVTPSGKASLAPDPKGTPGTKDSARPSSPGATTTPNPRRAPTDAEPPEATLYPSLWLGIENSMDLTEPIRPMGREDRKGDIRLNCEYGCMLKSRSSVMTLLDGKQRGTYATCRAALGRSARHDLPLAGAKTGSDICVKLESGDIALLEVKTKSTAVPSLAFVTADLRIWRPERP
ncbi:serine/threonine-protein kinase [Streptomyces solicathayae]|uniref:Serine/threonine-protein kinase n=1 Tax=Streptomyces solicathayae TaxID=3081768 RepID=A0ABZ0LYZ6_9ACTN|nr:serine/threonine-protein kinase [Streptomyces sp. HUAS YS2]WOX24664.1 serine/threonine-protein kinase [Streptomyces sp. HUAS YS2]